MDKSCDEGSWCDEEGSDGAKGAKERDKISSV